MGDITSPSFDDGDDDDDNSATILRTALTPDQVPRISARPCCRTTVRSSLCRMAGSNAHEKLAWESLTCFLRVKRVGAVHLRIGNHFPFFVLAFDQEKEEEVAAALASGLGQTLVRNMQLCRELSLLVPPPQDYERCILTT